MTNEKPTYPCHACGSRNYYSTPANPDHWVCLVCHPPSTKLKTITLSIDASAPSDKEIHDISLDNIDPNPFNTRTQDPDPDYINGLATSIAINGLLQAPVGRWSPTQDNHIELAAGHNRLAAYRRLATSSAGERKTRGWSDRDRFLYIPIHIRPLTDEQMFEINVAENEQRRDLTPIERARAIHEYITTFERTSTQAGQLFGLSDGAIRNYIRLLNLPEPVKDLVATGDLSQATARKLLTAQRILPESTVNETAAHLAENQDLTEDSIDNAIRTKYNADRRIRTLHNSWDDTDTAKAGSNLWLLNEFTPGANQPLTYGIFIKHYPEWQTADGPDYKDDIKAAIKAGKAGLAPDDIANTLEIPIELAQQIGIITNPPVCSACPSYAKLNGNHYCGIRICWINKRKEFVKDETQRLSDKTGIAIYQTSDGPISACEQWDHYSMFNKAKFQKWIDEKDQHLRLKPKYSEYNKHPLTNSYLVHLVTVRPEVKENKEQAKIEKDDNTEQSRLDEIERRHRSRCMEMAHGFLDHKAAPIFGQQIYKELNLAQITYTVKAMCGWAVRRWNDIQETLPKTKKDQANHYRSAAARLVLRDILDDRDYTAYDETGIDPFVKYLAGLAKELGVKLPANFTELADEFQPDPEPEPETSNAD
jgi:ParB/RepB/Spo0J family partition protein